MKVQTPALVVATHEPSFEVPNGTTVHFRLNDEVTVEAYKERGPDGLEVIVINVPQHIDQHNQIAAPHYALRIQPCASNLLLVGAIRLDSTEDTSDSS